MLSDCITAPLVGSVFVEERNSLVLQLIKEKSAGIVGSSYCEFGRSIVACYVLCPRPVTKSTLVSPSIDSGVFECEVSTASHIVDDAFKCGVDRGMYEKKLSHWTQQALSSAVLLHHYPKQLISLSIVVLQSSGHDFAAAVNAGTLALADASIHLADLPCSATITKSIPRDPSLVNAQQTVDKSGGLPRFTLAELPLLCKTTNMAVEGRIDAQTLQVCQKELHSSCIHIRSIMRKCLETKQRNLNV